MKKKKVLLTALVAATMAVSAVGFASCDILDTITGIFNPGQGEEKDMLTVTWTVAENATVKAEGYDALPTEAEKETELVFTVAVPEGYKATVKINNSLAVEEGGKYKVTITKNTKINVAVAEMVSSVEVQGPESPVYYAGETINAEEYVVTVSYATGRKEVVDKYSVNYGAATGFAIGDTEFTVEVGGVKSAPIALGKAVEAKITLNAVGGTIDQSVLAAYEARTDFTGYTVDDDGVITITYTALTEELVLPTAAQVAKGKEGDFTYVGWYTTVDEEDEEAQATKYTSVTTENAISLNLTLKWDAALIIINNMYFSETNAEGEAGAYLVLNVSFKAVDSAYLYLYEGNDKVEMKGDVYTASGNENDDLYFDCSMLGDYLDGGYAGKWMDVCFNAVIDGVEYSQSFALDHEYPIAQVGPSIQDAKNSYVLLTYRTNNKDWIKLAFRPYETTYGFDFHDDTLTVSGKINTNIVNCEGATASLTIDGVAGSGAVAADGTWSIDYKLADLPVCGRTTFSNLEVTGANKESLLSAPLRYTAGSNAYDYDGGKFGSPSYYSTRYDYKGYAYYVGNMGGDWQMAFYAVEDVGHKIDYVNMALTTDADGLYMVFNGTYGSAYTAEEAKAAIAEAFYADLQVYPSWAMRWYSTNTIGEESVLNVVTNDDGTFQVICNLSAVEFAAGDICYGHFGGSSSNMSVAYVAGTVVYNGLQFRLGPANGDCANWMNGLSIIYVTTAE